VARTFQNVALAGLAVEAFMQLFGDACSVSAVIDRDYLVDWINMA